MMIGAFLTLMDVRRFVENGVCSTSFDLDCKLFNKCSLYILWLTEILLDTFQCHISAYISPFKKTKHSTATFVPGIICTNTIPS